MTEGTSQGLFIVVAIVIFGIFVSLSYTLFGKTLQPQMVGLFETALEKVNDNANGVVERKLLDLNTISLDFPDNGFTLDKDIAGNKLTLSSYGGSGGIKIPTKGLLKENTTYSLSFDLKLLKGTINNIGGHLNLAKESTLKVNGSIIKPELEPTLNDWSMGVKLPDELNVGDTVNIQVLFKTLPIVNDAQYPDNPIKIQPNRLWTTPSNGYGPDYTTEISKLSFLEMKDNN